MRNDDLSDFRRQCERSLQRTVEERMLYGFCYVYKPVMDDAPWRSFDSTAAYRKWCRENLPEYLGYGDLDSLQKTVLEPRDQFNPRQAREVTRRFHS